MTRTRVHPLAAVAAALAVVPVIELAGALALTSTIRWTDSVPISPLRFRLAIVTQDGMSPVAALVLVLAAVSVLILDSTVRTMPWLAVGVFAVAVALTAICVAGVVNLLAWPVGNWSLRSGTAMTQLATAPITAMAAWLVRPGR